MLTKFRTITLGAVAAIAFTTVGAGLSFAADIVGLITKTETNPFFVKMREGAAGESQGARHRAAHRRRQVSTATTKARWPRSRT